MKVALLWIGAHVLAAVAQAAPSAAEPFELSRVRLLDGPFKQIQELHRTGLVGQLEPDKLLFGFRKNAGLPQPAGVRGGYGGWDDDFVPGHYAGHYLSAAARLYAATGDLSFRNRADAMVTVLAECQERLGGGYLSAFPASRFDKLETAPQAALVPYYTAHKVLAGLVDVAKLCGNTQALAVAERMSDYFAARLARLTPEQVERMLRTDYAGNPVNEFGGMAEALAELYAVAAKEGDACASRHLKLAAVFNRAWLIDPLVKGQDKLGGLHGNTHIAQACGLARYALATGDGRSGKAAAQFWTLMVADHSFVNGGNSFWEKLRDRRIEVAGTGLAALDLKTAETCNTHNMLKLSSALFQREPCAAYADYMELALYNHILASIAPDSGRVTYFLPLRPGGFRTYLNEPVCCQGTGIENAARFGEAIYFHRGDALWVNLFIASTLDWREQGLRLRLETRYPETGAVRLSLEADRPAKATIRLRIPAWLQGAAHVKVNGEIHAAVPRPGDYLTLTRTWKTGDVIELDLPLALRLRPSMDDPATVSFFYGPVLLAGELGRDGMPDSDIGGNTAFADDPPWSVPVLESPAPEQAHWPLEAVAGEPLTFQARMVNPRDQKPVLIRLSPLYRVHHQRFAVYWKALTPGQMREASNGHAQRAGNSNAVSGGAAQAQVTEVRVDGKRVAWDGAGRLRLPGRQRCDVAIHYGPASFGGGAPLPERLLHRLVGVDKEWQETGGRMRMTVSFSSTGPESALLFHYDWHSQSPGWRGLLTGSSLSRNHVQFTAPPFAAQASVRLGSDEEPDTTGVLGVAGLRLYRKTSASVRTLVADWSVKATSDAGGQPRTAQNWRPHETAPGLTQAIEWEGQQVLMVRDGLAGAGGGWQLAPEAVAKVEAGATYELEWEEVYSIGAAGKGVATYADLKPGQYDFRLQPAAVEGGPSGQEVALTLVLPLPLLQRPWFWAVCALGVSVMVFGVWRYFEQNRNRLAFAQLERERAVDRERGRIARDIHDDLGVSLTQIALQCEVMQDDLGQPEQMRQHVAELAQSARDVTRTVDEIVWAVTPGNDTLETFTGFIGQFVESALKPTGIACRLALPAERLNRPMSATVRHSLYLVLREALHNVIRHAGATTVRFSLALAGQRLTLTLADDGCGFAEDQHCAAAERLCRGNGLSNMRKRMAEIGGEVIVVSVPGQGTTLTAQVDL